MSKMLKKVGQTTLEYVIILTAIVAAILVGQSIIAQKSTDKGLGKMMDKVTDKMNNATLSGLPGATEIAPGASSSSSSSASSSSSSSASSSSSSAGPCWPNC